MLRSSLRLSLAFLLAVSAPLVSAQMLPDADLVSALRGGGYVIVVRHGATNADQADTDPLNVEQPGNEAKQRHLNDKGRDRARAWKEAFRKMGIPVGKVYSSKFFRAHKPNVIDAFGKDWFDVKEGEASVFKPDGQGGYKAVGRVPAEQWSAYASKYPKS